MPKSHLWCWLWLSCNIYIYIYAFFVAQKNAILLISYVRQLHLLHFLHMKMKIVISRLVLSHLVWSRLLIPQWLHSLAKLQLENHLNTSVLFAQDPDQVCCRVRKYDSNAFPRFDASVFESCHETQDSWSHFGIAPADVPFLHNIKP